jgi:quercetin dioxygenase-like cupin family protein
LGKNQLEEEFDMRTKLMWLLLSTSIAAIALYQAEPARATPGQGFSSTTIAQGQFGEIDVFNQFIPPTAKNIWLSWQKTKGASDGSVLVNVWQPGGSTGWHTHLGHTLIFVTAGAVTQYEGDDPSCTPHVYTAGMTFVDPGGSHVHLVKNEGTVAAQVIAVRLIPAGQPGRIDAPDPGNCHF